MKRNMTRAQRIVVVVYLLVVAYCCTWVPWCVRWHIASDYSKPLMQRMGYGWLWAGPSNWSPYAIPDYPLIAMRLFALTAICGAVYLALALFRHERITERPYPELSDEQWKVVVREFKRVHVPEETNNK
jgi:hypothetical protein